jgi:hypothetical protein
MEDGAEKGITEFRLDIDRNDVEYTTHNSVTLKSYSLSRDLFFKLQDSGLQVKVEFEDCVDIDDYNRSNYRAYWMNITYKD